MSETHLPECTLPKGWGDCICTELRACEARVLTEAGDRWVGGMAEEAIKRWRMEGVQAARGAVAALRMGDSGAVDVGYALAAIDALKEAAK